MDLVHTIDDSIANIIRYTGGFRLQSITRFTDV